MIPESGFDLSQRLEKFSFIDYLILSRLERSAQSHADVNVDADSEADRSSKDVGDCCNKSDLHGCPSKVNDVSLDRVSRTSKALPSDESVSHLRRKKTALSAPLPANNAVVLDNQEEPQTEKETLQSVQEAVRLARKRARKHQNALLRQRRKEQRKREKEAENVQKQLQLIELIRYNKPKSSRDPASQTENEQLGMEAAIEPKQLCIPALEGHDVIDKGKMEAGEASEDCVRHGFFEVVRRVMLEQIRLRTRITTSIVAKLEMLLADQKKQQKCLRMKQETVARQESSIEELSRLLQRAVQEAEVLEQSIQQKRSDLRTLTFQKRHPSYSTRQATQGNAIHNPCQEQIALHKMKNRENNYGTQKNQTSEQLEKRPQFARSKEHPLRLFAKSKTWNSKSFRDFLHAEIALTEGNDSITSTLFVKSAQQSDNAVDCSVHHLSSKEECKSALMEVANTYGMLTDA